MLINDLSSLEQAMIWMLFLIVLGALGVMGCLFEYLWRFRRDWNRMTPPSWRDHK